jgi:hypothetical protein
MGWHVATIAWAYDGETPCWLTVDDTPVMTTHAWQPDQDEGQCARALDAMLACDFVFSTTVSSAATTAMFERNGQRTQATHEARRHAMLLAACDALDSG